MYNYPFVLTISQPICTTILFGLLTLANHIYNMLRSKKSSQINVAEYYDTGDYTMYVQYINIGYAKLNSRQYTYLYHVF